MRKLVVAVLVVAAACHNKVKQETTYVRADAGVGIEVASNGTIVLKSGVLVVPMKVTNRRDRFVQVFFDRCEIESQNGERRHRRPSATTTCTIGPGRSETFKLIFGDSGTPLMGNSFRIWLWVQPTDGSGVIENVPPLVFGAGSFEKPAQGFSNANQGAVPLPPPTEPPPPTPPPPPPGTEVGACPTCGEERPKGSKTCPHCGLP